MVDFINELIACFAMLIDMLFNKLPFVENSNISFGYVMLALSLLTLVATFFYGRVKQ